MKIVLIAEESAGAEVLRFLVAAGQEVAAVLTSDGTSTAGGAVRTLASKLDRPTLPASAVRDASFADRIHRENVDLILNVHSLFIVPPEVVAAPKIGSFNLHPSPLPRYAGLNAPSWAIYHGEQEHGVTVHWMDPVIDAGPIAFQARFEITPEDTGLSLSLRCIREGLPLIERLIAVSSQSPADLPSIPQDRSKRTYFGKEVPNEGRVAWTDSAQRITDFARAADYAPFRSPWGMPWAMLGDKTIKLRRLSRTGAPAGALPGTVGEISDAGAAVAARDEWVRVARVSAGGSFIAAHELLEPGQRLV